MPGSIWPPPMPPSTFLALLRMTTYASASRQSASSRMCSTVDPSNLSALDGIGSILYNMAGTPFTPEKFERVQEVSPEAH